MAECPLHRAERRLDDAALLWKAASEKYFSPNDFRVSVQSAIQSFRSVTWILQSHKQKLSEFDKWYSTEQEQMREDPILRWLVGARNRIEKQGDLDTKSLLKVSYSASWHDSPRQEEEFPANLTPEQIISVVSERLPPQTIETEEALLRVERSWIDAELPTVEILRALAHCFLKLMQVLNNAHHAFGVSSCDFPKRKARGAGGLPSFMLDSDKPRIAWLKLKERTTARVGASMVEVTNEANQEVAKRYELPSRFETIKSSNFCDRCTGWFQVAKQLLKTDGFHVPTMLFEAAGGPQIYQLRMNDRAEKHLIIRDMASKAVLTDATAVIFVNEAWVAPASFAATGKHAIDCPERGEALVLTGLTKNGETASWSCRFKRTESKIQLGEEWCDTESVPTILTPFFQAWNLPTSYSNKA